MNQSDSNEKNGTSRRRFLFSSYLYPGVTSESPVHWWSAFSPARGVLRLNGCLS